MSVAATSVQGASASVVHTSAHGRLTHADAALRDKWERLLEALASFERLAVAFSGGVDSALLLRASQLALDNRVVALFARTETIGQDDVRSVREVAASLGVRLREVPVSVMGLPDVTGNTSERCCVCKREIQWALCRAAMEEGFSVVAEGSTSDDDYRDRPGHRAVAEFGVRSPLHDARLGKAEVRLLSRELRLTVWDKPSPVCLATRLPTGTPLDVPLLRRIDAAQLSIRALGFRQFRVRCHGNTARLELPTDDFARLLEPETRSAVVDILDDAGFRFGCLDLSGFRSGNMNAPQGPKTPVPSGGTS